MAISLSLESASDEGADTAAPAPASRSAGVVSAAAVFFSPSFSEAALDVRISHTLAAFFDLRMPATLERTWTSTSRIAVTTMPPKKSMVPQR